MATYLFAFKCSECEKKTSMRYIPPYDEAATTLSCKNCEVPLLKVYNIQIYHRFRNWWEHKYKVYNIIARRWILGSEDKSVSRDSFWGWVNDHNGERIDD